VSLTDEAPRPPVAAYRVMERLLFPQYFLRPPPEQGVQLTVVGADRVPTVWCLTDLDGIEVARALARFHPDTRVIASTPYNDRNRKRDDLPWA
jgi:hypothetical protein